MSTTADNVQGNAQLDAWLDKKLDELLPTKLEEIDASKTPSMSIIATKGTLDWAYPPFILASTAAALGWDVTVFFTFYGLLLLKKEISAKVSSSMDLKTVLQTTVRELSQALGASQAIIHMGTPSAEPGPEEGNRVVPRTTSVDSQDS